MALNDYLEARRLGLKAYAADTAARRDPYLPALDDRVEGLNALPRTELGLISVPIERVCGTYTKARTNAFASNFMPLLEPNSEFAQKWARLYDGIVEFGVKQPITCVEYMGRYYVMEGNKRVSVMKRLGVVMTEAVVTRINIPVSDDPKSRLWERYLRFCEDTTSNIIWLSEVDSYDLLTEISGHVTGEKWPQGDVADLKGLYYRFCDEYRHIYGERIRIPAADAFIMYLKMYGYDANKMPYNIAEELEPMEPELMRTDAGETVSIIMEPDARKSGGILSSLFKPSSVKAAFLYHRSPRDSGWNYWHELGRINAENELGSKLESTVCVCETPDTFESEMERLISEGNRIIFATSPLMLSAAIHKSLEHPEVEILNCSLLADYYHVRSYYLRIYEAKFIIGMIAGALTPNDMIGYIADYPIYGVPASINAFALGARVVNPRAKVYLKWSSSLDFNADDPFPGLDIRLISNRDISAPSQSSLEYGLYSIEDGVIRNLAIPLLDWSKFYVPIIRSVLNGTFDSAEKGVCALDYWWGMSSDTLDVILSTHFDPYLHRLVNFVQTQLESGQFWPFEGQLIAQDGTEKCSSQSQLTPADIITMDYLLDNVIGSFPRRETLKESARSLVDMQGILEISKPDKSAFSWNSGM